MNSMKYARPFSTLRDQQGIALVTALIITLVSFLLIMSTLYMITSSTSMSGAGKRYATASEAADGTIQLGKEAIIKFWELEGPSNIPPEFPTTACEETGEAATLSAAIQGTSPCTQTLTLPSSVSGHYTARITITYLYTLTQTGSRIEFPPKFMGGSGIGMFYRISTIVTGPDNTTAENSVLYRFTG